MTTGESGFHSDQWDTHRCRQCLQSLSIEPAIYSNLPSAERLGRPVVDFRCKQAAEMNAFVPGGAYGGAPIAEVPREKKPVLKNLIKKLKPKSKQRHQDIVSPVDSLPGVKRSNAKVLRKPVTSNNATRSMPLLGSPGRGPPSLARIGIENVLDQGPQLRPVDSFDVGKSDLDDFNVRGHRPVQSDIDVEVADEWLVDVRPYGNVATNNKISQSFPSLAWLFDEDGAVEIADLERQAWEDVAKQRPSLDNEGRIPGSWESIYERQPEISRYTKADSNPYRRRKLAGPLKSIWNEAEDGELQEVLQLSSLEAAELFPADSAVAMEILRGDVPAGAKGKEAAALTHEKPSCITAGKAKYMEQLLQQGQDEELARSMQTAFDLEHEEALMATTKPRECVVCGDEKEPLEYLADPVTSACDHPCQVCTECLHSWIASEFETKGTEDFKCPECPNVLSYQDIQRAASSETFEAFDRITARNALASLPNFAWCLGPNCGSGQLNFENANFMDCISCHYKQCINHRCAWHKDETCKQYDYRTSGQKAKDEESATQKMIDEVSKLCPGLNCGWRIQKLDGCDHMTCRRCRHEFCWQCLAPQSEIKRVGNTAHKESCKFHSKNLDLAWPFNVHAGVNRAVGA